MNWMALLGILALAYSLLVFCLVIVKKPEKIWDMAKIQDFVKVLGEVGTRILFAVIGTAFLVLAIWLFLR